MPQELNRKASTTFSLKTLLLYRISLTDLSGFRVGIYGESLHNMIRGYPKVRTIQWNCVANINAYFRSNSQLRSICMILQTPRRQTIECATIPVTLWNFIMEILYWMPPAICDVVYCDILWRFFAISMKKVKGRNSYALIVSNNVIILLVFIKRNRLEICFT